jgi:membrane dipeptidase
MIFRVRMPAKSILCFAACGLFAASLAPGRGPDATTERARKLHFSSLVLDTHVDTTLRIARGDWDFKREHGHMPADVHSTPESTLQEGHVDLPRIRKGGLNALFFGIVVRGDTPAPKSVLDALRQIDAVHRLAQDLPNDVALATTAAEVRAAHRRGAVAALVGMEGGHMIANSLPILRTYARLGVRYITLTHFFNTDWADSSGEAPRHNGLTPLGRDIVREMNRIGVMADISHVSDKTFWDVLEASQAPLIASHSSCRALAGHVRNMSDEMIKALAARGGVIHINYNTPYLDQARFEYWEREQGIVRELRPRFPADADEPRLREEVARRLGPVPRVTWEKIVEHIDHVVQIAGAGHVGLGSDFDGATMPEGMEDVTMLPKITEALVRRGYRDDDVRKILGENTLRVMAEVERVAAKTR